MNASREKYWRRARTLTLILLAIWLLTTISVVVFARQLATVSLWDWPLHYYFASQGATLVYLAIVGVYAWIMQRLDATANSESHDER
jgi:putative solute:sodium symporter small subunit